MGREDKPVLESDGVENKLVLESDGVENKPVLESEGVENKPVLEPPSERVIEGRVKFPVDKTVNDSSGKLAVELFTSLLVEEAGEDPVIEPFLELVALEP